ncbi:DNA polymerase III subunit gamma/tau [Roseomonas mucosa]|uniref:DNA polymerase III subunit gamma/tau n=1 Tax=Roseomonas mucosa TaxID=207340 RepID=A0A4Y1MSF6_9PROT|nr:DNA polymerase III subunit gamma/tau [Roseomonas mucosa]AWV20945.1 DNA polymerase III subunit gamma/tau [Roseomonas mucosa]MDT8278066.1 DNA polymerase III subunit gamma/tau [Roseomonas mucosa]MDT8356721.1 DNA polymerase III subunit gamma/tau [Roseomonas mucosa]
MPSDLPSTENEIPEPPAEGPGLFGDAPASPAPGPLPPPASAQALVGTPAEAPAQPYRVLARKYRPTSFADLVGQDAMVRTLRNAFAQNRIAHAFMLTGIRGVGKTTTARIIARALNCTGPDGQGGPTVEPCGVCPDCRAILADRHPDVMELDAASNNGVDNVRELREQVRFRPVQGRCKVFILDEVHMLSGPAFNALLKTLEEPPPGVRFIFATTELRKVPATILSRCQTFHLRRMSQAELAGLFSRIAEKEGARLEPEALAMIARAADGSARDGLSLLDQAIALSEDGGSITAQAVRDMLGLADRALVLDVMEAAMRGDVAAMLSTMDRAHEVGADPGVLLSDLAELVHQITRLRSVPALRNDPTLPEELRGRGAALADRLSIPVLGRAWQMLLKGLEEIALAPDRRAAAEMVLIRLAHVAEMPTPGEILRRLQEGGSVPAPQGGGMGGGGNSGARMAGGGPAMPTHGGGSMVAGGGGSVMAAGGGGAVAYAEAAPAPQPGSFREVVALASGRKPMLHAHLVHSVRLVSFGRGRLELNPLPQAPRDLAAQLTALLSEVTGRRWTVVLSNAGGEPTLAEQGKAVAAQARELAESHPLVQAVLAAFPGAEIADVRDNTLDEYGLPPAAAEEAAFGTAGMEEGDDREFAPPDAEPAGMDDLD